MDYTASALDPAPTLFAGEQRYQRVKRALTLIGVGKSTLYRWISQGRVHAIKVGERVTMIDMLSVENLFRQSPQLAPTQHVERRTISAAALGLEEAPDLPAPPDPDGPLPAFTLNAADLDDLASPPGAAPSNSGR